MMMTQDIAAGHPLLYWMSSQALLTFGAAAEPWLRHKP